MFCPEKEEEVEEEEEEEEEEKEEEEEEEEEEEKEEEEEEEEKVLSSFKIVYEGEKYNFFRSFTERKCAPDKYFFSSVPDEATNNG